MTLDEFVTAVTALRRGQGGVRFPDTRREGSVVLLPHMVLGVTRWYVITQARLARLMELTKAGEVPALSEYGPCYETEALALASLEVRDELG